MPGNKNSLCLMLLYNIIIHWKGLLYLNIVLWPISTCSSPFFRKELVWPELDQLLRDEDDVSGASTPYQAAIPEYRVVFIDSADASFMEKNGNLANGHAVHDIQHPCRYGYWYTFMLLKMLISPANIKS